MGFMKDTFTNLMSGLGMLGRDKSVSTQYSFVPLMPQQLEAAYRSDWIARKCIRIPAQDSTRQWRSWQADNSDITKIEDVERTLLVKQKTEDAIKKARLYGGAILLLGVNQGDPNTPLVVEKVRKGDLQFIHVVPRYALGTGTIITDITSPWYLQPEYYEPAAGYNTNGVLTKNVRVHPSRVIKLIGNDIPDERLDIWGDSILQAVDDAIKGAGTVIGSLAAMIQEAKLDIIKMPGLSDVLSTQEGTNKVIARFANANVAKSVINSILLDSEEEWSRGQLSFAGMPELVQAYLMIASAAVDVPATRFLSRSPSGLNATGDSDTRNYYDRIKSDQETDLQPAMTPLDEILIRSALGARPTDVFYNWNPLWQMTPTEKAALEYQKAQATQIYSGSGLIPVTALSKGLINQLIEDGVYPGLEQAVADAEAAGDIIEPPPSPEEELQNQIALAKATKPQIAPPGGGGQKLLTAPKKAADWAKMNDAMPRTLYVYRELLNKDAFVKWAKGEGFTDIIPDLHVTIIYSKAEVDWLKMGGESWGNDDGSIRIPPGGPRVVEPLGDMVTLQFAASRLAWRHEDMKDRGASSDYEGYIPHVSIAPLSSQSVVDFSKVKPFQDELIFGPEIFRTIDRPPEDEEQN